MQTQCLSAFPVFSAFPLKMLCGFDPRLALEKRTIPNRYRSFFRALAGLESSMSTLRSGPRRPRSPGPRAPSRALFMRFQTCTHLHPVDLLQMKNKKVFMLFNTNTRVRSNTRPEPPPSGGVAIVLGLRCPYVP